MPPGHFECAVWQDRPGPRLPRLGPHGRRPGPLLLLDQQRLQPCKPGGVNFNPNLFCEEPKIFAVDELVEKAGHRVPLSG
jgi:hypothetical protein